MRRWSLVWALALVAYGVTLQTGYSWQDSGGYQLRALNFAGTAQEILGLGIAQAHPAYVLLIAGCARVTALLGNPVLGVTFASAIGAAIALANVWTLVCGFLTRRNAFAASLVTVLLGTSHMFWWMATVAEVYTWSCALLTAELLLLLRAERETGRRRGWCLTGLSAVTGLHLAFHDLALLAWPVYAVVVLAWLARRKLNALWLAPMVAAFALGAAPFLWLFVTVAAKEGFAAAVSSALFGHYSQEVLGVSRRWAGAFKANMALHALSYLNPLWLFLPLGAWRALRREGGFAGRCLAAAAVLHFTFFIRYNVADQATFALPSLTLFALLTALGLDRRMTAGRWWAVVLAGAIPTAAYFGVDAAVRRMHVAALEQKEKLPFRDEVRYWVKPWKMNEKSADRMVEAVLRETETNAVVVGHVVPLAPLMARQAAEPAAVGARTFVCWEDFGADRRPPDAALCRWIRERPVYAMRRQDADAFPLPVAFEPKGALLRLFVRHP